MQTSIKTYLSFVPFLQIVNWSVQSMLGNKFGYSNKYTFATIGNFIKKAKNNIIVKDNVEYKRITVKINNKGVILRDIERGENIGTKKQFIAKAGQFIISKIDARNGAFGIVPQHLEGAIVTNDFPLFDINMTIINPHFLVFITTTKEFIKFAQSCSSGTTNRQRMDIDMFLNQKIPLPPLSEQEKLVHNYYEKIAQAEALEKEAKGLEGEIEQYLFDELGIEIIEKKVSTKGLQFIQYKDIERWGEDKILKAIKIKNTVYKTVSFDKIEYVITEVFRGKSPTYSEKSTKVILNQKCNRWNDIDLNHSKTVDEDWVKKVDKNFLTKEGDILINSTGEGTLGRSSYITREFEGFLYDSHLLLLRLDNNYLDAKFFVEIFNNKFVQKQIDEIKTAQSTKQTELGIENLKKIIIPIPLLGKQQEIVNHIIILKNKIKAQKAQAEALKTAAEKEFETAIFG